MCNAAYDTWHVSAVRHQGLWTFSTIRLHPADEASLANVISANATAPIRCLALWCESPIG